MSPREIEAALVAQLCKLSPGEKGDTAAIRAAIGCTAADLKRAIEKLRMQGKILWGRLEVAASLRPASSPTRHSAASSSVDGAAGGSGDEPEGGAAEADASACAQGEPEPPPGSAGAGGGGADTASPPSPAPGASPPPLSEAFPPQPTGGQLFAEISAYLARTGMAKSRFGDLVNRSPQLVEQVRQAARPRLRTVERIRAFIAANPEGVPIGKGPRPRIESYGSTAEKSATMQAKAIVADAPAAAPPADAPLQDKVRHEAEVLGARRRLARSTSGTAQVLGLEGPLNAAEQIQTALAEQPADLMRAVNRRHPELWRRVLALGRRDGDKMPSLALYRALEAGLDQLEREAVREPS